MNTQTIVSYTKLPEALINRLSAMSAKAIYNDAEYIKALSKLDKAKLQATLPLARKVYESHIHEFKASIKQEYGVNSDPMSAYTLGNWVVGVLQYPKSAHEILNFHKGLTAPMFRDLLDNLVDLLDEMPDGSEEWKQALTLLAFPLMNK